MNKSFKSTYSFFLPQNWKIIASNLTKTIAESGQSAEENVLLKLASNLKGITANSNDAYVFTKVGMIKIHYLTFGKLIYRRFYTEDKSQFIHNKKQRISCSFGCEDVVHALTQNL